MMERATPATGSNTAPRRIAALHAALGIPPDYAGRRGLPLCPEARSLVEIGVDCFGRPQRLTPGAARAFARLRTAAAADGIVIEVVSAFRDIDYQAALIRRKLDAGQPIARILEVSAAPGFSEHHTGRALDLTTPGLPPLDGAFAASPAYRWLRQNAEKFGFAESYPAANPYGLIWEPWHWAWRSGRAILPPPLRPPASGGGGDEMIPREQGSNASS